MTAIKDRLHALRLAWSAAMDAYHRSIYLARKRRSLPDYF